MIRMLKFVSKLTKVALYLKLTIMGSTQDLLILFAYYDFQFLFLGEDDTIHEISLSSPNQCNTIL